MRTFSASVSSDGCRVAKLGLELRALAALGLKRRAQHLELGAARLRLVLEHLAGVHEPLQRLVRGVDGRGHPVGARLRGVDKLPGRQRALLGSPSAGLRKAGQLCGFAGALLGGARALVRLVAAALGGLGTLTEVVDARVGRRALLGPRRRTGTRQRRRARRGLCSRRCGPPQLAPDRRRGSELGSCAAAGGCGAAGAAAGGGAGRVGQAAATQRRDERLDLLARRHGRLDDAVGKPGELEHPPSTRWGHTARRRPRPTRACAIGTAPKRRATSGSTSAVARGSIAKTSRSTKSRRWCSASVRARSSSLSATVVDEDLGQAAPGQRGLERRLHRGRLDETTGDDDVRQEAVGRPRPSAAA